MFYENLSIHTLQDSDKTLIHKRTNFREIEIPEENNEDNQKISDFTREKRHFFDSEKSLLCHLLNAHTSFNELRRMMIISNLPMMSGETREEAVERLLSIADSEDSTHTTINKLWLQLVLDSPHLLYLESVQKKIEKIGIELVFYVLKHKRNIEFPASFVEGSINDHYNSRNDREEDSFLVLEQSENRKPFEKVTDFKSVQRTEYSREDYVKIGRFIRQKRQFFDESEKMLLSQALYEFKDGFLTELMMKKGAFKNAVDGKLIPVQELLNVTTSTQKLLDLAVSDEYPQITLNDIWLEVIFYSPHLLHLESVQRKFDSLGIDLVLLWLKNTGYIKDPAGFVEGNINNSNYPQNDSEEELSLTVEEGSIEIKPFAKVTNFRSVQIPKFSPQNNKIVYDFKEEKRLFSDNEKEILSHILCGLSYGDFRDLSSRVSLPIDIGENMGESVQRLLDLAVSDEYAQITLNNIWLQVIYYGPHLLHLESVQRKFENIGMNFVLYDLTYGRGLNYASSYVQGYSHEEKYVIEKLIEEIDVENFFTKIEEYLDLEPKSLIGSDFYHVNRNKCNARDLIAFFQERRILENITSILGSGYFGRVSRDVRDFIRNGNLTQERIQFYVNKGVLPPEMIND